MGRWGGWGTFVLFCFAKALHMAVFSALAGPLLSRWYAIPAVAALWAGIERTHGPLGFAWLTLGNAGVDMPVLARLAPWAGVYALSFAFALIGTAMAIAFLRRVRREWAWLVILLPLAFIRELPANPQPTDTAAVLQPNMPEEADWTDRMVRTVQERLAVQSLELALKPERASVIVWPEVPGPLYYYNDAGFHELATQLARTTQSYFLFGTVAYTPANLPLNSAVMLSPAGSALDRYDKMFLVPFGEFIPPLFGFVNRITKEAGDFTPGNRVVVFPFGEHRLGNFICYESAFPHLVRQFANGGADVLANISNDGYFGRSAAREQHLKLVRMRAIENRRWIIRSTNDGISAIIDPSGRVTERLPMYKETGARMRFGYEAGTTFYTRHGDWFAWSCLAAGFGLAGVDVAGAVRRNRARV